MAADVWEPAVGQVVTVRADGTRVEIMDLSKGRVATRPLRGGRETDYRVGELIPPDDAPGGFVDWQVSRG
ncbi:hypothetical protein GCM10009760_17770 [Kitasatospora kazusensis]|uniref:Uncharacterized protein n=1 Tax=Kitasatospora kazusensis TaxID=407974 RepID=A0ABN2Z6D6_9ACTN